MLGSPSAISSGQTEHLSRSFMVQTSRRRNTDPHAQLVIRVNKLLAASHPMKSDGGIDGSGGGLLSDVLCDER